MSNTECEIDFDNAATIWCPECDIRLCDECDEIIHIVPAKATHTREAFVGQGIVHRPPPPTAVYSVASTGDLSSAFETTTQPDSDDEKHESVSQSGLELQEVEEGGALTIVNLEPPALSEPLVLPRPASIVGSAEPPKNYENRSLGFHQTHGVPPNRWLPPPPPNLVPEDHMTNKKKIVQLRTAAERDTPLEIALADNSTYKGPPRVVRTEIVPVPVDGRQQPEAVVEYDIEETKPVTDYKVETVSFIHPQSEYISSTCQAEPENGEQQGSAIDNDHGYAFLWGGNDYAQLGFGNYNDVFKPTVCRDMPSVTQVACGDSHTLFLTATGLVMVAGSNAHGQLGLNNVDAIEVPTVLNEGLSGITAKVAAGSLHSLALTNTGDVWAWGSGTWGKLGLGNDKSTTRPQVNESLTNVVDISCGADHSAAVHSSGDVYTWGNSINGQTGHNTSLPVMTPTKVAYFDSMGTARTVACGSYHTAVLLVSGELFVFGAGQFGELGTGLYRDEPLPVSVMALHDYFVTSVHCGASVSIVKTQCGRCFAWGNMFSSQSKAWTLPRHIDTLPSHTGVRAVYAGQDKFLLTTDEGRSFMLKQAELENGHAVLEQVAQLEGVSSLSFGHAHAAAICYKSLGLSDLLLDLDKEALCDFEWTPFEHHKPSKLSRGCEPHAVEGMVVGGTDAVDQSPSYAGDGTFWVWGKGQHGRLGNVDEISMYYPVVLHATEGMSFEHVSAGKNFNAAITDTGKLYSWGGNANGQLGQKHFNNVFVPRLVPSLSHCSVSQVSCGRAHMILLTDDRRVFTTGSGLFGQLGIGEVVKAPDTMEVITLSSAQVKSVCAGGWHSVALTESGTVYTFGKGWHGQLGHGDYSSFVAQAKTLNYPKAVEALNGIKVIDIHCGLENVAALTDDKSVYTWGLGQNGQLGHGDRQSQRFPKLVEALQNLNVYKVKMGLDHAAALTENGVVYTWGSSKYGQCGHGDDESVLEPKRVECSEWFKLEQDYDEEGEPLEPYRGEVPIRILDIDCDVHYTVFLTAEHILYTCGAGKGGKLASELKEDQFSPLPINTGKEEPLEPLSDIRKFSCGIYHMIVLRAQRDTEKMQELCELEMERLEPERSAPEDEINPFENQGATAVVAAEDSAGGIAKAREEAEKVSRKKIEESLVQNPVEERLAIWLSEYPGLDKYFKLLIAEDVDIRSLHLYTEEDFREMGITALGARRQLVRLSAELHERAPQQLFHVYRSQDHFLVEWPESEAEWKYRRQKKADEELMDYMEALLGQEMRRQAMQKALQAWVKFTDLAKLDRMKEEVTARYFPLGPGTTTVAMYGRGFDGQLGHGYNISYPTPTEIKFFKNMKICGLSCGSNFTIARNSNGQVYSWGRGEQGQLGLGKNLDMVNVSVSTPTLIRALNEYRVADVACGAFHCIAFTVDREVFSWGDGSCGQLGLGNDENQSKPRHISDMDELGTAQVSAGGWHSACVTATGKLYTWGKGCYGQLGLGEKISRRYPTMNRVLRGVGKVTAVFCGVDFTTCIVDGVANAGPNPERKDKVFTWGFGGHGQLGHNDKYNQRSPVELKALSGWGTLEIACGLGHCVAVNVHGQCTSWGSSEFGQLGHGGVQDQLWPTVIESGFYLPSDIVRVAAGHNFSMALSSGGKLYSWGQGTGGELGLVEKVDQYVPMQLSDFSDIIDISAGPKFASITMFSTWQSRVEEAKEKQLTLPPVVQPWSAESVRDTKEHGYVYVWGQEGQGYMGLGKRESAVPRIIPALSWRSITAVAVGLEHSCALTDDGVILTWGNGEFGRLGHGTDINIPTPRVVQSLLDKTIIGIACGAQITLCLTEDGDVYSWGYAKHGNLGYIVTANVSLPRRITKIADPVAKITAGRYHCLALSRMGDVYSWGRNVNGQLGLGELIGQVVVPQLINDLHSVGVLHLAAGDAHSLVVTESGLVYSWGSNAQGQLGHGDFVTRIRPTQLKTLPYQFITTVVCGGCHSMLINDKKEVFTFGSNSRGQLGHTDGIDLPNPQVVQAFRVSNPYQQTMRRMPNCFAGPKNSCAVTEQGELYMWGTNEHFNIAGHSEVGGGDEFLPIKVEGMHNVVQVASGPYHTLCLVNSTISPARSFYKEAQSTLSNEP